MNFALHLRQARLHAGLTQYQAAQSLGITPSAYCGYETGKRQPDIQRLRQIAALFHTSVDELLGIARPVSLPTVSPREFKYVEKYRSLDPSGQRLVRLVLDELSQMNAGRDPEPDPGIPFRISEQSAAAGLGAYLGPDAFRMAHVRRDALPRGASFGVPVCGDSMEPQYHDRDILIVSDAIPQPGDVGVFIMEGAGYVKVLGTGELLSLNPAYAPIPIAEGIRACGKVIGVLHDEDFV